MHWVKPLVALVQLLLKSLEPCQPAPHSNLVPLLMPAVDCVLQLAVPVAYHHQCVGAALLLVVLGSHHHLLMMLVVTLMLLGTGVALIAAVTADWRAEFVDDAAALLLGIAPVPKALGPVLVVLLLAVVCLLVVTAAAAAAAVLGSAAAMGSVAALVPVLIVVLLVAL